MKTLALLLLLALLSGCANLDATMRKIPAVGFESWTHSDRYGLFTDKITVSGAKWTSNPDGSATLTVDQYDGDAAWAGAVGPHDTLSKMTVTFPANSPQALAIARKL